MSEWKGYKFSDFAEINPKVTLQKNREYAFIEMQDVELGKKYVLSSQRRKLAGGARFENGDTLFARITPCLENGKINQAAGLDDGKGFGSTEFLVFRGREGISDTDFVYYLSKSWLFRNFSELAMTGSSGRQRVPKDSYEKLVLRLPGVTEQQAIAEILSSLDEKIELYRKQNRTLEAIAQALFKHWFVEFEFPHENGQPYKSSGGAMQPSDKSTGKSIWTAVRRPEEASVMDGANQMGEIEHVPLSDVIEVNPKCSIDKGDRVSFVDMKALPTSGMSVMEVGEKLFSAGSKFQLSDTLLARITPCLENGKTAYVDFLKENEFGFGSTEFIVLRAKKGVCSQYVYCFSRDPIFRKYAIKSMVGSSGRQRVQVDLIKQYPASIADERTMERFDSATKPIFQKISHNRREIITLTKLRDTLLPKLMSGGLRVEQANQLIEGTA